MPKESPDIFYRKLLETCQQFGMDEESLKKLFIQIQKTGVKAFYKTPLRFREFYAKDDWVQEAFRIFLKLIKEEYAPDKDNNKSLAQFVTSKLSLRLTDKLREFYKSPPVECENGLRGETGISDFPDTEQYLKLESSKAQHPESKKVQTEARTGISPEDQVIRKEARQILWGCIEKLKPVLKLVFIRHFIQEISYVDLSQTEFKDKKGGSSERLRHKGADARKQVKTCVEKKYGLPFPA